jgi:Kelch motif
MWAYDVGSNTWTQKADMPTARSDFGAALAPNGLIYALGGWNGAYTLAANEAYNPVTNSWVAESPLPKPETDAGVATMATGAIEVTGGGDNAPLYGTDSNQVYSP